MEATRVLVANELRSYREAIAKVMRSVRPDIEIYEAEPEDLNWEVTRLRPDLVVCSQASCITDESYVPIWVELYPDCKPHSVVSIEGKTTMVSEIQLPDLLALLGKVKTSTF